MTKDEFLAGFIGDILTNELYYSRPESSNVWRISRLNLSEKLEYAGGDKLKNCYALLRDSPSDYSELSQKTLGFFKKWDLGSGSIGLWMARLWKREVAAAILPAGTETPWDSNPVLGLCEKLGYLFFCPGKDSYGDAVWRHYKPQPILEVCKRNHDTLVIHEKDWTQLNDSVLF